MRTIVVYDKETMEVIAAVPDSGDAVLRNDVDVSVFDGTEPVFEETKNGVVLSQGKFIINPA